jgi:hypothetical protein
MTVVREHGLTQANARHLVGNELGERDTHQRDLTAQDLHGAPVILGPGHHLGRNEVVDLPQTAGLPEHSYEGPGGIIHVQELLERAPIVAYQDRQAATDAIDPAELPGKLPDQAHLRPVGGGGLEDGHREAFPAMGFEEDRIGSGLGASVVGGWPEGVVLRDRQRTKCRPVSAHRGALDEVPYSAERPHAAQSILRGEAHHVDGSIEVLALHGSLEQLALPAVPPDDAYARRRRATPPPVEASHLVSTLEQLLNDTGADVASPPDDACPHELEPNGSSRFHVAVQVRYRGALGSSRQEQVRDSFAAYLRPLAPYLDAALISPEALADIADIARVLPERLALFTFGFECRLGEPAPQADFLLCATAGSGGRDVLAQPDSYPEWPAAVRQDPTWQRVFTFAQHWAEEGSTLQPHVDNVWLEFDVERPPGPVPVPSLFFAPEAVVGRTRRAEDTAALVTASGLALLLDENPRDIRARLAPVFEALPGRARVFQVGAMLSRRTDTVRLCIDRLEQAALMELVEQLGGAGPADVIRDAVQAWSGLADEICLNLDMGTELSARIGLECYFLGESYPERAQRLRAFLDQLVEKGLCTPAKRAGVLAYPGVSHEQRDRTLWPELLLRSSSFMGPGTLSVFVRDVHHLKLVCHPGGRLEAKAYLSAGHRWY